MRTRRSRALHPDSSEALARGSLPEFWRGALGLVFGVAFWVERFTIGGVGSLRSSTIGFFVKLTFFVEKLTKRHIFLAEGGEGCSKAAAKTFAQREGEPMV